MTDQHAIRELTLFIDNDHSLYQRMIMPIIRNLARKKAKGIYERDKAVKFISGSLVRAGITKYKQEFGSFPRMSAAEKQAVAADLLNGMEDQINEEAAKLKKG